MPEKLTLKDKVKVVKELFDEGAESIEISGGDLKVTKRQYRQIVGDSPQSVVVSVINQNTIQMQLNISIRQILEEVKQSYDDNKYKEAKKHLSQIEKELRKKNPDKSILKKGILWAAKFGERVFWQLLPLIIQHYGKLGVLL